MRINLKTPFADKDAAKALGARWDGARKIWYITDVADLTPFMRWIPDLAAATQDAAVAANAASPAAGEPAGGTAARQSAGVITRPTTTVPHCDCKVLPWVGCEHST